MNRASSPGVLAIDRLQVLIQSRSIKASKLARSWPPSGITPNSLDHGLQVYLRTGSITASKFTRAWPPSESLSSLDLSLQVRIQTRSITASKCISDFTQSTSPSASQTCSIKYIIKERHRLYGYTTVTEVDRVPGSIQSRRRSITACSQSRHSLYSWVAILIHRYVDENTN